MMRLFGVIVMLVAIVGVGYLGLIVAVAYPFWSLGVSALIFFVLMATYQFWLFGLLRILAHRDIVVTIVEEGTGQLVMRNGKAWRGITSDPDTDPGKEGWDVPQEGGEQTKPSGLITKQHEMHWLAAWVDRHLLPGGMRWIGFKSMGYELHWYNFRWSELRPNDPGDKIDGLVGRRQLGEDKGKWVASFAKRIKHIFLKDTVFYFEVNGVETKGVVEGEDGRAEKAASVGSIGMSIDIRMVVTMRVVNFYLALIFIHDYLESILDLLRPHVRQWASENTYEQIIGKPESGQHEFDLLLRRTIELPEDQIGADGKKSMPLGDYIFRRYGVRIKRIGFVDVVPPTSYTAAAEQRAVAEQNKIRVQTDARAEKKRLEIIADGEAARLNKVNDAIKAGGDTALRLRELQTLEDIGGHGNLIVVPSDKTGLFVNAPKAGDKKGEAA